MGVHESSGILGRAIKDLVISWNEARIGWKDAVSENFEKTYLLPLQSDLRMAQSALDQMSVLLNQIHRD